MVRTSIPFVVFSLILLISSTPVVGAELNLALADSTCTAMKEVGAVFSRESGISLKYICKSSGMLVGGIRAGIIKADFFLTANQKWMDSAAEHGMIKKNRVQPLLTNELVVVSLRNTSLSLNTLSDLASPKVKKIIIGDPSRAPFGRYAKQALQKAKLWDAVKHKISSRKKISLAVKGLNEADDGTVAVLYRTELTDFMRLQLKIPRNFNDSISYYYAPIATSEKNEAIEKLITFLHTTTAGRIFKAAGFKMLPKQL